MSVATMPPELALDALPTLPIVALQIGEVIHSRVASVAQVATVLRADPATSAKLLRLVNSPYFGIPGGVSDVARAIPFVGFNTLYQLVLTISVLDTLDSKDGFDPKVLWLHSLTVATAARELAADVRFSDAGSCFTAGLLHDMGRIALARLQPAKMAAVFASTKEGMSVHDAERLHQIAPHDALGSRLAKQWKFPATLAVPIEQHHAVHKPEVRDRLPPNLRTISEIVSVADAVAKACAEPFTPEGGDGEHHEQPLDELLERNGYGQHRAAQLIDRTKKELERSKVFLSLLT